jgi:hypothetical protein
MDTPDAALGRQGWIRDLLALLLLGVVVGWFARRPAEMLKGTDFPEFYAAAQMVRQGQGSKLYDPVVQATYQARYTGRTGTYFNHPPFETLIYLPFSLFPPARAYALWCWFNAALLVVLARLLARFAQNHWGWSALVAISFVFVPMLLNFLQGQDSLLLLFLLVLAWIALRQGHGFMAGFLLACGLFKFHLLIPATIPFFFHAPRKVFGGFFLGVVVVFLISLQICGWSGLMAYPQFLQQQGSFPLAGIHESAMANFRGLFAILLPNWVAAAHSLTLLASVLVVGFVIYVSVLARHERSSTQLEFAAAMLAALLVGYHLSPHDLTLLLLPIVLIVHHVMTVARSPSGMRVRLLLMVGILLLPPLHLLLLRAHLYAYMSLPVTALFALTCAEMKRAPAFAGR